MSFIKPVMDCKVKVVHYVCSWQRVPESYHGFLNLAALKVNFLALNPLVPRSIATPVLIS